MAMNSLCLLLVALAVACSGEMGLPADLDPADFVLEKEAFYRCGRWINKPDVRFGLFDVRATPIGETEQTDRPSDLLLDRISSLGGVVVHEFNVPLVRAVIALGAIPEIEGASSGLSGTDARAVTDASEFSVTVSIRYVVDPSDSDLARIVELGGEVFSTFRTAVGAVVPDLTIPVLRGQPEIENVGLRGGGCLAAPGGMD
ncbi:MAG: hypothetical protein ACE5HT_03015 [Gemmatimonadales bacterium]